MILLNHGFEPVRNERSTNLLELRCIGDPFRLIESQGSRTSRSNRTFCRITFTPFIFRPSSNAIKGISSQGMEVFILEDTLIACLHPFMFSSSSGSGTAFPSSYNTICPSSSRCYICRLLLWHEREKGTFCLRECI